MFGTPRTSGPGFGIAIHEDALELPRRWASSRTVFVNSMSDLFHARGPVVWPGWRRRSAGRGIKSHEAGWGRCHGMTGNPFGTDVCHLRPLRPGDIPVTNDLLRGTGQDNHGPDLRFQVELRGFEPLTPSMRTRCATGLRYSPWNSRQRSKHGGLLARSVGARVAALTVRRSSAPARRRPELASSTSSRPEAC